MSGVVLAAPDRGAGELVGTFAARASEELFDRLTAWGGTTAVLALLVVLLSLAALAWRIGELRDRH
ncbi:hypothetical protein ACFYTF_16565 [Nocardia thailandica]|uniref:Uncharacterized protein n=1 Tax=Nocardia thailandica TaxID=257275 RepID=A0ABW6PPV8_9NOCA